MHQLSIFFYRWLIDFKEFMAAVTPKGELPEVEMPIIRCKHSALILFNDTHDYAVDKHTIDRCVESDNVAKYKFERKWFLNYKQLEAEIERRVNEGVEKKRKK